MEYNEIGFMCQGKRDHNIWRFRIILCQEGLCLPAIGFASGEYRPGSGEFPILRNSGVRIFPNPGTRRPDFGNRKPELGSGRVISSSSIKDKIFIFPWHLGHAPLNITVDSSDPLAGMAGIVSIPEYLNQLFYGARERVYFIYPVK